MLSDRHIKKVLSSCSSPDISPETAMHLVRSLEASGALQTMSADEANRRTGRTAFTVGKIETDSLAFNYFCDPELIRPRPDIAPKGRDGRPRKYISPTFEAYPKGNRLYFPPVSPADSPIGLAKLSVDEYFIVTEGELKGIALAYHGFHALALAGVDNFVSKKKKDDDHGTPIADLDLINWTSRLVLIMYDSDSAHNTTVQSAERRLKTELERRGARVVVVRLPEPEDEEADKFGLWQEKDGKRTKKFGADDFLNVRGRAALIKIIEGDIAKDDERRATAEHLAAVSVELEAKRVAAREDANKLVLQAIAENDVRIAYDNAKTLAALDEGGYDHVRTQLKTAFKDGLDKRRLDRVVIEARKAARPLRAVGPDETPRVVSGLPTILLNEVGDSERMLGDLVSDAWDAVGKARESGLPVVFRQGADGLVRLSENRDGLRVIKPVSLTALNGIVSRAARWVLAKKTDEGTVHITRHPRRDVVEDMLARPDYSNGLHYLERVGSIPIYLKDGTLVSDPGFHPAAAYFLHIPDETKVAPVASAPTTADIAEAKRLLLDELLVDFPFAGEGEIRESNRAHAVAMLLQPFMRDMIDGRTPAYLIEAPTEGTGKGLLAEVTGIVTVGRQPTATTLPSDDAELVKKLTTDLPAGRPIMFFDNLPDKRVIDLPSLAKVLTEDEWNERQLGVSASVSASTRCMWMMTGNNPRFSKEITRRIVLIRLDSKMDKPDARAPDSFRHSDLTGWAKSHRGELIWACLTLIQNWVAAGRPKPQTSVPFGSFQAWSDSMGAILELAGIPGWLKNRTELRERNDQDSKVWTEFFQAWWTKFESTPVKPMNLVDLCIEKDLMLAGTLGDGTVRSQSTRLGVKLSAAIGKVFGGLRITETQGTGKLSGTLYLLEKLPDVTPSPDSTDRGAQADERKSPISPQTPVQPEPQESPGKTQTEHQGAEHASRAIPDEPARASEDKSSLLHEVEHNPHLKGGRDGEGGIGTGPASGGSCSALDSASEEEPEILGIPVALDPESQDEGDDINEFEDSW